MMRPTPNRDADVLAMIRIGTLVGQTPSYRQMSEWSGLSLRTITNAVRSLEEMGLVRRGTGVSGTTGHYHETSHTKRGIEAVPSSELRQRMAGMDTGR